MDKSEGILLPTPNSYGYRVNISHPAVEPLYRRFKRWKGIPWSTPLSDAERFEFEAYIIGKIKRREKHDTR